MLIVVLSVLLGLCATGGLAVAEAAGHRLLLQDDGSSGSGQPAAPLSVSDLVIVYTTTVSRLPLVHASRPARRGIRTVIVLQDASEASRLNGLYGGPQGEHNETYIAWLDAAGGAARGGGGNGGPYGRMPPPGTHPLHAIGPAWAMAPLLAHAAVLASTSTPPAATVAKSTDSPAAVAAAAAAAAAAAPPPYRWMLLARDDTLWLPRHAVRLLSQYDAGVAAAVSDHLIDFNGRRLLAPSAAAAVCLPCGMNLTALLGRRHPPGVPQPACPVCRPAGGCEFRFDLCGGLVGGPQCASKRFLGSGDRCAHSWVAGGAGVALSVTLLGYLDQEDWSSCVRGQRPSTGERSLGRCMWRHGVSFTHPATGLAEGLTRDVFSDQHMLFGNPLLRQAVFGPNADALLGPAYKAEEEEAVAAAARAATRAAPVAAAAAAVTGSAGHGSGPESVRGAVEVAAAALPVSTRVRPPAAAGASEEECDVDCRTWLRRSGVSVHLDVPYTVDGGVVDVAAAAVLMVKAAEDVAKAVTAAR